jgi:hypothetical protein
MAAKEERAYHLELHKMTRAKNELSKHNAVLEAECNQLRTLLEHVSEKHAAENDALSKRHATAMETERVKINALLLELNEEKQRIFKKAQENNEAQRQFNANVLTDAKRMLDDRFNAALSAALNDQQAALDAAIHKLNEERMQIKHTDLMREKEYKQLAEQMAEQMAEQLAAQRKTIMDEGMEEKRRQEARFKNELNEQRNAMTEEKRQRDIQFAESMRMLNEEHEKKMQELQRAIDQNSRVQEQVQAEMENAKRKMSADLDNHKLKVRLELDTAITETLHDAVTSNCTHMQWMNTLDFTGKRIMLYSHYSESNEVQSYNVLTIECMQHYFDYIIILTNCPNKWNMMSPNYNQCHILNYNMKSDFRNYGVFIMQIETSLVNASRLCLTNDSFIVVDVNAFSICIKRLFDCEPMSHDFVGLTSSYENVYHLQSYFICFGSTAIPAVVSYFKTHGLPFNHADAIVKYELGMSLHLTDLGFTSFASVTNNDMPRPLNTTCCKWSNVLEKTGIVKRQHFLKKYAYAAMTDKEIEEIAQRHAYNAQLMEFLKCNVRAFNVK